MQIFSKVYCFLPHAPSLLADHVNSKHTEQTVKRYHCIQLGFPQILLTTTFSCSFSSLVSFAFLFSLVSFAFCLCVCVCVFSVFLFCFFFEMKNIYSGYTFDYEGRYVTETFSRGQLPETRILFLA